MRCDQIMFQPEQHIRMHPSGIALHATSVLCLFLAACSVKLVTMDLGFNEALYTASVRTVDLTPPRFTVVNKYVASGLPYQHFVSLCRYVLCCKIWACDANSLGWPGVAEAGPVIPLPLTCCCCCRTTSFTSFSIQAAINEAGEVASFAVLQSQISSISINGGWPPSATVSNLAGEWFWALASCWVRHQVMGRIVFCVLLHLTSDDWLKADEDDIST